MQYSHEYLSPIGPIVLASDGDSITGLWFRGQRYFARGAGNLVSRQDLPIFADAGKWLDKYFSGKNPSVSDLRIAPVGTEFRKMVWDILINIPYGNVITYGDIARRIAKQMGRKSMSPQAIGNAVGHNPISIIIPCHRVVGATGGLTGYAGGIDKKIKLLEIEKIDLSKYTIPTIGTAI